MFGDGNGDFKQPFPIRKDLVKIIQLIANHKENWLGSLEFQEHQCIHLSTRFDFSYLPVDGEPPDPTLPTLPKNQGGIFGSGCTATRWDSGCECLI